MLEKQKSFHHVAREILESPYLLSSHFVFGRTSISISKRLHHSVVGLSQLLFVQLTYVCAFVRPSSFFFIFLLAVMLTSSLIGAWKCNSCRKLWQTDQTERLINQPTDKQSERPGHKNSRRNIDFFWPYNIYICIYILPIILQYESSFLTCVVMVHRGTWEKGLSSKTFKHCP